MNKTLKILLILLSMASTSTAMVKNIRCEYLTEPLGINVTKPRLSWITESNQRAWKQTAYQILVATSEKKLQQNTGDLWDTGKVRSGRSIHIEYAGKPLKSKMFCHWKVRVWDKNNKTSVWSEPSMWSMGLLKESDWQANWIGEPFYDQSLLKAAHNGYQSTLETDSDTEKWVCIDFGSEQTIDTVKIYPADGKAKHLFPVRFRVDISNIPKFRTPKYQTVVDCTDTDQPNPGDNVWSRTFKPVAGRYILLRITRLAQTHDGQYAAALGKVEIFGNGKNLTNEKSVTSNPSDPPVPPSPLLRRSFEIKGDIKRATVYATALGIYELRLNGQRISDHIFAPEWTDYRKRLQYQTYDVTKMVQQGENVIGAILGDGWYAGRLGPVRQSKMYPRRGPYGFDRRLLLRLDIEKTDGRTETIVSDENWKMYLDGPIRRSDHFVGELYNATKEIPHWDRIDFDDKKWQPVIVDENIKTKLVAQKNDPVRIVRELQPIAVTETRPGVYVFDMGQNMVGFCRIQLDEPAGSMITLRHAEVLKPNGFLKMETLGSAIQTDKFICDGKGKRCYEPSFTFHGFRYVEVVGLTKEPTLDMLTGRVISSHSKIAGSFECSNNTINKITHNIIWTQLGNRIAVPTDCPQRDERLGWLGDLSVESKGGSFAFDVAGFYAKWLRDIADAQADSGNVADVAPVPPGWDVLYTANVTWPSTYIILPGWFYQQYADKRLLQAHYPNMKKWIDFMSSHLKRDIMSRDQYGDWCIAPKDRTICHTKDSTRITKGTVLATCYFYHDLCLMESFARILGKTKDAKKFQQLAEKIKTAFNKKFFNAKTNLYSNGTQTSSILPLAFKMVPAEHKDLVINNLTNNIRYQSDAHIGTGLIGVQWIMRTLSDNGRVDLAYKLAANETYPSWGYMVTKGATTMWELWNGDTADSLMNSHNHLMLTGDLQIWIYEYVLGIKSDPEDPGFKKIIIKPQIHPSLKWAKGHYDSMHGRIATNWKLQEDRLILDVTIPANTTATVYIPADDVDKIKEGGISASQAKGVNFLRMDKSEAVFMIGSGNYRFTSKIKKIDHLF